VSTSGNRVADTERFWGRREERRAKSVDPTLLKEKGKGRPSKKKLPILYQGGEMQYGRETSKLIGEKKNSAYWPWAPGKIGKGGKTNTRQIQRTVGLLRGSYYEPRK